MSRQVLKQLTESRNTLKRKFDEIKQMKNENALNLEETFKPITAPLNEILADSKKLNKKSHNKNVNEKKKTLLKKVERNAARKYVSNSGSESDEEFFSQDSKTDEDEGEDETRDSDSNEYEEEEEEESLNEGKGEGYDLNISKLKKEKILDNSYGPRKENNILMLGNSTLKIKNNKMELGSGNSWTLTQGLYSLIFHNMPSEYSKNDLETYKKILIETSAHKRYYDPNEQLKGNRSTKYASIVRPLMLSVSPSSSPSQKYTGSAYMKLQQIKPNYVYWNDVNELVERLQLLMSSRAAGNNNHTNEILSIIEELREAKIIY